MHFLGVFLRFGIVLALALWMAVWLVKEIRSGIANAKNTLFRRSKQPAMFWLTIVAQSSLLCVCLYALVKMLRDQSL